MTKRTFAVTLGVLSLVAAASLIGACSSPGTSAAVIDNSSADAAPVTVASGCRSDDDCPIAAKPVCLLTMDAGSVIGVCSQDPDEKDANTPCRGSGDCGRYQGCGYRVADGCSATIEYCFDNPNGKGGDLHITYACGCDGGAVAVDSMYDGLHAPAPVRSIEECANLDAGDAD